MRISICAVCGISRDVSQMRNIDTVSGADSEWIYACNAINPHGLGGTCYGKYDRERHFNPIGTKQHMRELFEIPPFTPDHHLRALSWKQPFADLMFHGKIETRTWSTKYRGWVLICASQKPYNYKEILSITGDLQMKLASDTLGPDRKWMFNCGIAIGIGYLSDCREMTRADEDRCFVQYHSDLYCHIYEQVIPFNTPKHDLVR